MRGTEHFKRHLSVRTQIDNRTIRDVPVEDPFHHTTVTIEPTFWEWLRLLFQRRIEVRVKVVSDGVSRGRWFQGADICEKCQRARIDEPLHGPHDEPGYHHGKERWCHDCYYGVVVPNEVVGHDGGQGEVPN